MFRGGIKSHSNVTGSCYSASCAASCGERLHVRQIRHPELGASRVEFNCQEFCAIQPTILLMI